MKKVHRMHPCSECGGDKDKPYYRGQRCCRACRELRKAYRKGRNALNCWERMIYQRYKLRPKDYFAMLKKQRGKCAICKGKSRIRLSVDHNHKTKKLRGLLCVKCNTSLGYVEGRKTWMKKAQAYLLKWERKK